jgi:hypothetical protein
MGSGLRKTDFFATGNLPIEDRGDYVQITFWREKLGEPRPACMTINLTPSAYFALKRQIAEGPPGRMPS